jgi:hypothetical protein
MALIRNFEIPGTGVIVSNAYYVITKVDTEKRLKDIMPPPDSSRSTGYTYRDDSDESQWIYWKAGYIGKISIEIFASRQARDEGKTPVGAISISPTSVNINGITSSNIEDYDLNFFIDPTSQLSIIDQAYDHLKKINYLQDAAEA